MQESGAMKFKNFFSIVIVSCMFIGLHSQDVISNSVEEQPFKGLQEPPRFVTKPQSVTVEVGEPVIVDCVADGNPLPTITWQRSIFGVISTLPNNSLIIHKAYPEDSGRYSCVADNVLGQIYTRFNILVRVHGGLSKWSEWNPCDSNCGEGKQFRYRYCNNPPPRNGGKNCRGPLREGRVCQGDPCDVDGGFSEWSLWNICSNDCGGGRQSRFRSCDSPSPAGNGKRCNDDEAIETRFCNMNQCGVPQDVDEILGAISGKVNGIDLYGGALMANITVGSTGRMYIDTETQVFEPSIVFSLRSSPLVIAAMYWGVIKRKDSRNGFQLTDGEFDFSGQTRYSTGEEFTVHAKIDYITGSNVPLFELDFSGSLPSIPASDSVHIADFKERVFQVGKGKVHGYSFQVMTIGDLEIDAFSNYSIKFKTDKIMKPPSRTYRVTDLKTQADDGQKMKLEANIMMTENEKCPDGFKLNGLFCEDQNECLEPVCDHFCLNSFGSYSCQCKHGFELDNDQVKCLDLNECRIGTHTCKETDVCINKEGGHDCVDANCMAGYVRNNITGLCDDIDECSIPNICLSNQDCENTIGSYRCTYQPCANGYFRNLTSTLCEDTDECSNENACGEQQTCVNIPGSYRCEDPPCPAGFQRNATGGCSDIDECITRQANCSFEEMCKNLVGSYKCELFPCLFGYQRNAQKICEDINECKLTPSPCGPLEDCVNDIGAYYCYPQCTEGFVLNKFLAICDDIDECATGQADCPQGTICYNLPGSYFCIPEATSAPVSTELPTVTVSTVMNLKTTQGVETTPHIDFFTDAITTSVSGTKEVSTSDNTLSTTQESLLFKSSSTTTKMSELLTDGKSQTSTVFSTTPDTTLGRKHMETSLKSTKQTEKTKTTDFFNSKSTSLAPVATNSETQDTTKSAPVLSSSTSGMVARRSSTGMLGDVTSSTTASTTTASTITATTDSKAVSEASTKHVAMSVTNTDAVMKSTEAVKKETKSTEKPSISNAASTLSSVETMTNSHTSTSIKVTSDEAAAGNTMATTTSASTTQLSKDTKTDFSKTSSSSKATETHSSSDATDIKTTSSEMKSSMKTEDSTVSAPTTIKTTARTKAKTKEESRLEVTTESQQRISTERLTTASEKATVSTQPITASTMDIHKITATSEGNIDTSTAESTAPVVTDTTSGLEISTSTAPAVADTTSSPEISTSTAAPVVADTTSSPEISTSTAAPVVADTSSSPGISTSTAAPVVADTTSSPGISTSTAAPVVADTTSSPEISTSTAAPMVADTTSSPGISTSTAAPVVTDTTSSLEISTSTAAPVVADTTSTPEISTSTAAPVVADTTSSPEISTSTAAPVVTKTTSAPEISVSTSASKASITSTAFKVDSSTNNLEMLASTASQPTISSAVPKIVSTATSKATTEVITSTSPDAMTTSGSPDVMTTTSSINSEAVTSTISGNMATSIASSEKLTSAPTPVEKASTVTLEVTTSAAADKEITSSTNHKVVTTTSSPVMTKSTIFTEVRTSTTLLEATTSTSTSEMTTTNPAVKTVASSTKVAVANTDKVPEAATSTIAVVDKSTSLPALTVVPTSVTKTTAIAATTDESLTTTAVPDRKPTTATGGVTTKSSCDVGYSLNENGVCIDIDECANKPCEQFCLNLPGTYECSCNLGFALQFDGRSCKDFNECDFFKGLCGEQDCVNTIGSYTCTRPCSIGYKRNTQNKCEAVNECATGTHTCADGQICMNTAAGYRCVCPRGFKMSMPERKCVDIDECSMAGVKVCDQVCINLNGSYRCSCFHGYQLQDDGVLCERDVLPFERKGGDTKESKVPRPKCYDVADGVLCMCEAPYVYNLVNKRCEKTRGGEGEGEGGDKAVTTVAAPVTTTTVIKTTTTTKPAPTTKAPTTKSKRKCPTWYSQMCDWKCEVTGRYRTNQCSCPDGYRKYYYGRCHDTNECWSTGKDKCTSNEKCFNTKGSYKCVDYSCPSDYIKFTHGACEKSCRINGKHGYCRRSYIFYHTKALVKDTPSGKKLLTLRANENIVDDMGKAQFYIQNGNSNFKLRPYHDRAELHTARFLSSPGDSDVVIISDIFDSKNRLVCRTKFIIYIDIGEYKF